MIDLVQNNRNAVADLCRKFKVRRLDVFGSAATGEFAPQRSDLDFVVNFADRAPTGEYANRFLGLAEALERLFQRPVDLVTEQSIHNPYFRRTLEATRQVIYEGHDAEMAV
jgi:uncharacterized protein